MGVQDKNILIVGDRCRRKLFEPLSVFDDGKVYTTCRQEFGFAGFRYISSTVKKITFRNFQFLDDYRKNSLRTFLKKKIQNKMTFLR